MNKTINYQPTGVYKTVPYVSGQDMDGQGTSKKKGLSKNAKLAIAAGGAAATIGAIVYYRKGLKAFEIKNKILEGVNNSADLDKFIASKPHSLEEAAEVRKIWAEYTKFSSNFVGKTHRIFHRISKFFEDNFYSCYK